MSPCGVCHTIDNSVTLLFGGVWTTCVLCLARVVLQASVVLYPLVYYIYCNKMETGSDLNMI